MHVLLERVPQVGKRRSIMTAVGGGVHVLIVLDAVEKRGEHPSAAGGGGAYLDHASSGLYRVRWKRDGSPLDRTTKITFTVEAERWTCLCVVPQLSIARCLPQRVPRRQE